MDVKLCKFHSNAYESNHYWTKDLWLCNYYFMHLIELNIPILFVWRKKRLESSLDFIIPTRNPKCYWVHKLWINSYKSEFTNLYLITDTQHWSRPPYTLTLKTYLSSNNYPRTLCKNTVWKKKKPVPWGILENLHNLRVPL